MQPHNMNPQRPIKSAVSNRQKTRNFRRNWRERFFNTLKKRYPNVHILYVLTNIVAIWSGFFTIADSWANGVDWVDFLTAPAPEFNLQRFLRYLFLLVVGIIMLLLDDLSLKELMFGGKTASGKPIEKMNSREKFFHNFKTKHPSLSTIYSLFAVVLCWCGLFGWFYGLPVQPFWRAVITIPLGFFLLYIDDMKLDELFPDQRSSGN